MNRKLIILGLLAVAGGANAQSFTEGFESGPTGWDDSSVITFGNVAGGVGMAFGSGSWHALNASAPPGTTGWFNNETIWAPHGGTQQLCANFNNSTGSNAINNFMMSPVRTFSAGDKISFWTRTVPTPGFPDRLHLKLSTAGASTAIGSFTTTLLTINPTLTTAGYPTAYTQFTVTLASGGTGRFAFNYEMPNAGPLGANSDFISIDDVAYTAVPEPATMAALGLGAVALIRRRRNSK